MWGGEVIFVTDTWEVTDTYVKNAILWLLIVDVRWQCYFSLSSNKRWEEERYPEGIKWKFLEHKGPVFAPPYEPLPENVKFYYDGKQLKIYTCWKNRCLTLKQKPQR